MTQADDAVERIVAENINFNGKDSRCYKGSTQVMFNIICPVI